MKIVRFGNTESHLLLSMYIMRHPEMPLHIKEQFKKVFHSFTNYLYSDSGYYDKDVKGNHFNFDESAYTKKYFNYIKELEISVGDCESTQFYFSDSIINFLNNKLSNGKTIQEDFSSKYNITNFKILNGTRFNDRVESIYNYIRDKKVLVVTSFDGLVQQQYDSKNVYKIYPSFPELESLQTLKFPYCFNNNGPHQNYFETSEYMFNKIKEIDFDIAILSCAAYGHILTHKIHSELNKDVVYIGGNIQEMFGILSKREKEAGFIKSNEYWITEIPDEYIPKNCILPEDGCFW